MPDSDASAPIPAPRPGASLMGPASLVAGLVPVCFYLLGPLLGRRALFDDAPLAFTVVLAALPLAFVLAALPLAFVLGVAALSSDVRRGRRWAWAGAGGLVLSAALPLIVSAIRFLGAH